VFTRLFPFYGKELSKGDRTEWGSRVVSTLHALFVTTFAGFVLFTDASVTNDVVSGYNMLHDWNLRILIGYFTYDLLLVLGTKQLRTSSSIIHHVMGLLGAFSTLYWHQVQLFTVLFTFTEITTPFVNNRWFLAVAKKTSSTFYLVNGILMALGFVVVRVLMVPGWAFYAIYNQWVPLQDISHLLLTSLFVCVIGISLLNVYWTYLMIRGLLRHLNKRAVSHVPNPQTMASKKQK